MQTESRFSRWTPYALSLLRIFVALTYFQHGTHKYFNFPSGQSYQGINLATMQGWAGTIELFAGALILLGLFTRLAAFIASGEMAVGYFTVHAHASFFTARNGGENAYLFCFIFLFFVFAGPGPISLDYLLRRKFRNSMTTGNSAMKVASIVLLLTAIALTTTTMAQTPKSSASAAASPSAQQSPQPPPTIASAIDREISLVEKEVVEAAEAMPEEKYNFSPEGLKIAGSDYKGVRTFGEQVKHIAASNYLIWSPITGDKLPDTVNEGKGPDAMKAKAEIVKFLKESFAFGHKAVATLTSANLVEPIAFGKNKTTRLFLSTFAAAHCFDHYGQMAEYLRMNGIIPPASRKSE